MRSPASAFAHVVGFALDHPWAVTDSMMAVIAGILAQHMAGEEVDRAALEAAVASRKNLPQPRAGSIAIIPAYGVIAPRMNLMTEMSGGTTFEKLTSQVRAAGNDKGVQTMLLDIDSPGSNVAGATEFARELLRWRATKPIVAQIQYTGASGGYWIASCCTEVVAAPSARIGSVGIVAVHDDLSEALAKLGIKRTYLSAGEGKTDGNDSEPLSPTARARVDQMIGEAYKQFAGDVVKGRDRPLAKTRVTADRIRTDWKAYVYGAEEAMAIGMIDRIATLDETVERILSASPDPADRRAALSFTSTTDTPQESRPTTGQDLAADAQWQLKIERELLALERF